LTYLLRGRMVNPGKKIDPTRGSLDNKIEPAREKLEAKIETEIESLRKEIMQRFDRVDDRSAQR